MNSKERKFEEYFGDIASAREEDGDILFWSKVSTEEKFAAAWELITEYYHRRGRSDELRFSRSIETAGEV